MVEDGFGIEEKGLEGEERVILPHFHFILFFSPHLIHLTSPPFHSQHLPPSFALQSWVIVEDGG